MSNVLPEVTFHLNGSKKTEKYFLNANGKLHRENGPAEISYYESGGKEDEHYYINGVLHRLDGPAFISYHGNGKIKREAYYINGKCLS